MEEKRKILQGELTEHRTDIRGYICKGCKRYWGNDEHMAGWCCCTHVACEKCGSPTKKSYTTCEDCRRKRKTEEYLALEEVVWDGETALVEYRGDNYYWSAEDLEDELIENGYKLEEMQLVLCVENKPPYFDIFEFLADVTPEDEGPNPRLYDPINEAVNEFIQANRPYSWIEGNQRPSLESLRKFVRETEIAEDEKTD